MVKLEKFIKDNGLQFTEGRRNSDLVVLCGYALYLEAEEDDVWNSIPGNIDTDYDELENELNRVYTYAKANDYGNWWSSGLNRNQYKL